METISERENQTLLSWGKREILFFHKIRLESEPPEGRRENFGNWQSDFVTDFGFVTDFYHTTSSQQMVRGRKIQYQITTA